MLHLEQGLINMNGLNALSNEIASKAPNGFSLSIFLDPKIDINPIKYVHSLKIPGACSIKLIRP
jgi:hypothetical protein